MKRREQESVVDQAEWKQTPKGRDAPLASLCSQAGAEALLAPLPHGPQQSLLQSARTKFSVHRLTPPILPSLLQPFLALWGGILLPLFPSLCTT